MNSGVMRWLLDLDELPAGAEKLSVVWERPWPAWIWMFLLLAAAAAAILSYRRLNGSRSWRGVLAGLRAASIGLALVLISGPMLELSRETVERDWVLFLTDRSASMTIADGGDDGESKTRDEQLRDLFGAHGAVFQGLSERKEVRWLGFHSGTFALDAGTDVVPELGLPEGERTDLNASLEQALQQAAARPVSGIVVFTDGRTTRPPGRPLLRRLQAEGIGVFPVPLGSPDPRGDLALARVDAPRRAFVRDKVPVTIEIDRLGAAADLGGEIRLIDELTGEVLASDVIVPGDDRREVTLTAEPALAGEAQWRVEIETPRPDLVPENNERTMLIELVDRPLRVLYVEGYPRWEYRYLKNLLVREKSIDSSVILLSADRDFAQEGNQPITRMPRSPEELAEYDVVIFGDVPASFFSADQRDLIRSHVADRGAGLLWIGGPRGTPSSFAGTVLADLLPIRGGLELPVIKDAVTMRPTDYADQLGVLRIVDEASDRWPRELADPGTRWARLYGVQRLDPRRLKPTAEVLAETAFPVEGVHLPLVVSMRYGAGQSVYVATDEIWRWRYGRGESIPDQFWIQMVRMLGRETLSGAGTDAVITVRPRRIEVRQPLRVSVRLLNEALMERDRMTIRAVLESEDGTRLTELDLRRDPTDQTHYTATYLPDQTGTLRVRVEDPSLVGIELIGIADVYTPDDELRRPETDHDLLAEIARATGGAVVSPADFGELDLPNREIRTEDPLRERIWDTPLAFCLLLLTLTAEWVGRKILRLV